MFSVFDSKSLGCSLILKYLVTIIEIFLILCLNACYFIYRTSTNRFNIQIFSINSRADFIVLFYYFLLLVSIGKIIIKHAVMALIINCGRENLSQKTYFCK